MIGRVLAFALAMTVVVHADNCNKVDKGYQLMSDLTGKYCNGGNANKCSITEGCDCNVCCEVIPDSCGFHAMSGSKTCGSGRTPDLPKVGMKVGSGKFDDVCCMTAPNNTATKVNTCVGRATEAMASGKCGGKVFAKATENTAVMEDLSDYEAKCCIEKKTCDVTCGAGRQDKAAKATTKCNADPCTTDECCDPDPTTCLGVYMKDAAKLMNNCSTANKFPDAGKMAVKAMADGSDFQAMCCSMKATCEAFKGATLGGSGGGGDTSAATHQHAATVSLLFALGGGLVMGGF